MLNYYSVRVAINWKQYFFLYDVSGAGVGSRSMPVRLRLNSLPIDKISSFAYPMYAESLNVLNSRLYLMFSDYSRFVL